DRPDEGFRSDACAALGGSFSILFAGQMGRAQGLETALDAASLTPKLRWVFLGGGTERTRLEDLASARNLQNVLFISRVPMQQVRVWLEEAGALLVHLKSDSLFNA